MIKDEKRQKWGKYCNKNKSAFPYKMCMYLSNSIRQRFVNRRYFIKATFFLLFENQGRLFWAMVVYQFFHWPHIWINHQVEIFTLLIAQVLEFVTQNKRQTNQTESEDSVKCSSLNIIDWRSLPLSTLIFSFFPHSKNFFLQVSRLYISQTLINIRFKRFFYICSQMSNNGIIGSSSQFWMFYKSVPNHIEQWTYNFKWNLMWICIWIHIMNDCKAYKYLKNRTLFEKASIACWFMSI